ncbi:MAG: PTS sugar transporter subunit IIA [Candidatus Eiseniibacteriota bacterium]
MSGLEDRLPPERIRLDLDARSADDVIGELARLLGGRDATVQEAVRDGLAWREQVSPTGVGGGIAFPHARVDSMAGIRLAFVRTVRPIDFRAMDGRGVDLFLALAGPEQERREYLSVLGMVSYLFRSSGVREEFRKATTPEAVRDLVRRFSPGGAGVGGETL